jgi:hypothetical protein
MEEEEFLKRDVLESKETDHRSGKKQGRNPKGAALESQ